MGRREPPTPHSHKPTPGLWLAFLGAEERSQAHRDRVYPTTKKETVVGGSDRGNTLGYPDNLQEEQRKRAGGQRCELAAGGPEHCTGKGFLGPQPHGMHMGG